MSHCIPHFRNTSYVAESIRESSSDDLDIGHADADRCDVGRNVHGTGRAPSSAWANWRGVGAQASDAVRERIFESWRSEKATFRMSYTMIVTRPAATLAFAIGALISTAAAFD